MIFTLPPLPYGYDALEPYIDTKTMEIHHTKHHQTYVNNLNQAIAGTTVETVSGTETFLLNNLLKTISSYSTTIRNNAGGHLNHSLFWNSLAPSFSKQPSAHSAHLLKALEKSFGSFDAFKQAFTTTATARFGSGWVWLSIAKKDGSLMITSTANQDNPLMDVVPMEEQGMPILGLDVWEHAYYLFYQNRRLEYIEAFWHIIRWELIENRFMEAIQMLSI